MHRHRHHRASAAQQVAACQENDGDKDKEHKTKSLDELVREYRLDENLSRFVVGARSKAKGKTVAELDVHNRYGLTVLEIRRETTRQKGIIKV